MSSKQSDVVTLDLNGTVLIKEIWERYSFPC